MILFRSPAIHLLSPLLDGKGNDVDPSHWRIVILMEPERGDIRRFDLRVPKAAPALEVIQSLSKAFNNLKSRAEGADFAPDKE